MITLSTPIAMFPIAMLRQAGGLLAGCLLLASCNIVSSVDGNSLATEQWLDVGILSLEPNIPEDSRVQEKKSIAPEVRRAESRYIAVHLKNTLKQTGNWGAVRVIPNSSNALDVEITGTILESSGEKLKIKLRAKDATGKTWFKKTYSDKAAASDYDSSSGGEPFQTLYNLVAEDLLRARKKLSPTDLASINRVADLKYAEDLSPDAFEGYLVKKRSRVAVRQLPAENDSMMARVDRIKEQEYLFVDVLETHYDHFYREVEPIYSDWRHASYSEIINRRAARRKGFEKILGGALMIVGSIALAAAGMDADFYTQESVIEAAGTVLEGGIGTTANGISQLSQAETHSETLKTLSQGLSNEVTPYVLKIEGHTIELSGNVEQQYEQWRTKLREIYAEETGLTPAQ